jgi:Ni/Co efflux regulator RcnB
MKKIVIALAALAVLAAPAVAQRRGGGAAAQQPSAEDISKKQQAEALDQQYKATLKRMNKDGATARTDPWSNMRDTSDTTKK